MAAAILHYVVEVVVVWRRQPRSMLLAILTMKKDARFSISLSAYLYGSSVSMIMVLR